MIFKLKSHWEVTALNKKRILLLSSFVCLLAVVIFLSCYLFKNNADRESAEFIFAGTQNDADCTILISGDKCVLVDTGEGYDAGHIINLLQEKNVNVINYIILTHPDKDHIGGASEILKHYSVEKIITPNYTGNGKEEYRSLLQEAEKSGITVCTVTKEDMIECGNISIHIFPPERDYYKKSNDYSLALTVTHGDIVMFMAGDAEKERINELLKSDLPKKPDLYKTAHHGRNSKKGVELIEKLVPKNAIVTARSPEKKIAEAFNKTGTTVYTTVGNDIFFISDGKKLKLEKTKPII